MTIAQRDLMALYCYYMGIKSPKNIKNQIEEYEDIRELVALCDQELHNATEKEDRD